MAGLVGVGFYWSQRLGAGGLPIRGRKVFSSKSGTSACGPLTLMFMLGRRLRAAPGLLRLGRRLCVGAGPGRLFSRRSPIHSLGNDIASAAASVACHCFGFNVNRRLRSIVTCTTGTKKYEMGSGIRQVRQGPRHHLSLENLFWCCASRTLN